MIKSYTDITKYIKSILVLFAFTISGMVFAQESTDSENSSDFTSEENLQNGFKYLRLNVNPFSSESLRLYELRRETERLKLQKGIDNSNLPAVDVSQLKAEIKNYKIFMSDMEGRIASLELMLSKALARAIAAAQKAAKETVREQIDENIGQGNVVVPENPLAEDDVNDTPVNTSISYGYVDFGFGPRLYYGSAGKKKFADVNDYVQLPTSDGKGVEVMIMEITESYALLENGEKIIFPNVRGFLNAPPAKAFDGNHQ